MKKNIYLFLAFLMIVPLLNAQDKPTEITSKNKKHFITNTTGYPIVGNYIFVDKTLPIEEQKKHALTAILNADGTGIFQNEKQVKENFTWGIECYESGIPILKEGFNSGSYSFWYKKTTNPEEDDWTLDTFSIHFNNKRMYLSGKYLKEYTDGNTTEK